MPRLEHHPLHNIKIKLFKSFAPFEFQTQMTVLSPLAA